MRKIKLEKWKSNIPEYDKDGITVVGTKEIDEDLLTVINVLISNKRPEEMVRGLDKFKLFTRLNKAFEKADKLGILELEESDYSFLKEMIEKDVPSVWGMNKNISKAIESFLNSEEEK